MRLDGAAMNKVGCRILCYLQCAGFWTQVSQPRREAAMFSGCQALKSTYVQQKVLSPLIMDTI